MVGGSSLFALSAVAVEREIVGKDSEAELIEGEPCESCCCFSAAASRAAVAVWDSDLVLEEFVK